MRANRQRRTQAGLGFESHGVTRWTPARGCRRRRVASPRRRGSLSERASASDVQEERLAMALHGGMAVHRSCHGRALLATSLRRSHRGGAPPRSCPPARRRCRSAARACTAVSVPSIEDAAGARGGLHAPAHRPASRPPGHHSLSRPARRADPDVPGSLERHGPTARCVPCDEPSAVGRPSRRRPLLEWPCRDGRW